MLVGNVLRGWSSYLGLVCLLSDDEAALLKSHSITITCDANDVGWLDTPVTVQDIITAVWDIFDIPLDTSHFDEHEWCAKELGLFVLPLTLGLIVPCSLSVDLKVWVVPPWRD